MNKPKAAFICVHNSCRSQIADLANILHPMSLKAIPQVDIVVTMDCNVTCPFLPCKHREDWRLEDPSGKSDTEFKQTMQTIQYRLLDLMQRIQNGI